MRLTALFALLLATPVSGQVDSMVVTLLGTGTPNPRIERLGPSTLVEVGGKRLVFDVGRGTTIRLIEAGVPPGDITATFITHLHSDHTNGIPDLWLTGWLPPFGGRSKPFQLVGPVGTADLMRGLEIAYAGDIRMRTLEERLPPAGVAAHVIEFGGDTTVYDENGIKVVAFEVDHGGELKPAFGYRISYGARSIVISGDTRYSENLIRHASGADLILHEVAAAPDEIRDQPPVRFILSHHTSPAEAGQVFSQTRPRLAVFTHFAFPPNPTGRPSNAAEVISEASRYFPGRIEAGEDLMRITVSDSIRIERRVRGADRR
jgi:ribonuclease Z